MGRDEAVRLGSYDATTLTKARLPLAAKSVHSNRDSVSQLVHKLSTTVLQMSFKGLTKSVHISYKSLWGICRCSCWESGPDFFLLSGLGCSRPLTIPRALAVAVAVALR